MKEENEDNRTEDVNVENTENTTSDEQTNTEEQAQENNSGEDQIKELNDKYVRLYSEFDNYRKRTNKEKIELIANANASLLGDILPTLDDFERAIANNENTEDVEILKEGFALIYNKFKTVLENKGLKQMTAKGEKFDSEIHEAIANIPAPEESLIGCVVDDVTKGYYLNDKVIRHAKVVVGQ